MFEVLSIVYLLFSEAFDTLCCLFVHFCDVPPCFLNIISFQCVEAVSELNCELILDFRCKKLVDGGHCQRPTRDCCYFLLTMTWSIWLTECPFGDLQLSLWMSLRGKMAPSILHLLLMQKSTSLSPLSLMVPQPCRPISSSLPMLLFPTLAFKSPIINNLSCCGILEAAPCSCSYQSSFVSSSSRGRGITLQDGHFTVLSVKSCFK